MYATNLSLFWVFSTSLTYFHVAYFDNEVPTFLLDTKLSNFSTMKAVIDHSSPTIVNLYNICSYIYRNNFLAPAHSR